MTSSIASSFDKATPTTDSEPTATQVVQYLQSHPAFISEHLELLEVMELPHAETGGNAISLIEHQVARLRASNAALQQQLDTLIDTARENDALFARTRQLILAILAADSVSQLIERVEGALLNDFDAVASTLTLFSESPASAVNMRCAANRAISNVVPLREARRSIKSILSSSVAICGSFRPDELAFLFQDRAHLVKSAVVAPLGEGTIIGVLAIGSLDPDRYHSTIGTLFLNYITEVLNVELPKLLAHSDPREP